MFVYPSIYEGFGIPVLESLACGTATITSNLSSLPEVAGDAAVLVNPSDSEELFLAMKNLMMDQKLIDNLKRKSLIQANKFSWNLTAERSAATYNAAFQLI